MSDDADEYELEPALPEVPPQVDIPADKPKIEYGLSDAERRSRRFALLIAGIFLVPFAAIICGFCCCFAGLFIDPNVAIGGLILGVIGGIALSVHLLGERWRELK